jgi:hypothetical protein
VLSPLERALVEAVRSGEQLDLTDAAERELRAEVLRDALLARVPTDPDPRGLRIRGATVVGRLDLDGLRTGSRIQLRRCEFPDGISLRGATVPLLDLGGSTVAGLVADDLVVEGSALLWRGFRTVGALSLVGARIGGKLDLGRARLDGRGGPALVGDRMTIGSDLVLDDATAEGTAPAGAVQLGGTRVGGRLSARRLTATNRGAGPALSGPNLQVADTLDLSRGSVLTGSGDQGAVRLVGARAGSVSLGRARLVNETGWALAAHYLDVSGTLYLDRVDAVGGLRLSGSRIGGQVTLEGATVDSRERSALAGTRLQVAQAVVLDGATLTSTGPDPTVNLRSARVAGDLRATGTRLAHPDGTALRLNGTTVEGRAILDSAVIESGAVDYRDCTLGAFNDDPAGAPAEVYADGLVYRGLLRGTVRDRLAWLERMPAYAAQPYRQLAVAYQAAGHEDDARRVLVAQQERLGRALTGWTRLRHRLFGLTLQYGYQPLRAVGVLAVVLLLSVGLFTALAGGSRTEAGPHCPWVDRVGLAIDAAVPLVSTGADDRCKLASATGAGQALAIAGWALTLAGWASATLVVAGYTGLVRRR